MTKIAAVILNVVLFLFTWAVLLSEGPPQAASYWVFTAWALLTMILSAAAIFHSGQTEGWLKAKKTTEAFEGQSKIDEKAFASTILRNVTLIANIVFFGFVCWAIVDQYPHPEEAGVIEFTVLMLLTPLVSFVALVRSGIGDGWLGFHLKRKA